MKQKRKLLGALNKDKKEEEEEIQTNLLRTHSTLHDVQVSL